MTLKEAKEKYPDLNAEIEVDGKKMLAKDYISQLEAEEDSKEVDINGVKIPKFSDPAQQQKAIFEVTNEQFKAVCDTFNKTIDKLKSAGSLDNRPASGIDKKKFRLFIGAVLNKRYDLIPEEFKQKDAPAYGNEGDPGTGGYLVFDKFFAQIQTFLNEYGNVIPDLNKQTMASKSLKVNKTDGIFEAEFFDEAGEIEAGQPTLGQVEYKRHDCGIIVPFTKQLYEDSDFDLLNYIAMIAGYGFAKKMETCVFNGNTGQTLIKGLYNEIGVGSYPLTSPNLTAFSLDDIIDVVASLAANFRNNAKFYMHRSAWATIKKFKNKNGSYILDSQERLNRMLEGYPVVESEACNSVLDIGAATPFITFGDMRFNWLMQRLGMEMMSSSEASVKIGATTYSLFQRGMYAVRFISSFDIQPINPGGFVNIKTAVEAP